jgi:hypothetical protein
LPAEHRCMSGRAARGRSPLVTIRHARELRVVRIVGIIPHCSGDKDSPLHAAQRVFATGKTMIPSARVGVGGSDRRLILLPGAASAKRTFSHACISSSSSALDHLRHYHRGNRLAFHACVDYSALQNVDGRPRHGLGAVRDLGLCRREACGVSFPVPGAWFRRASFSDRRVCPRQGVNENTTPQPMTSPMAHAPAPPPSVVP